MSDTVAVSWFGIYLTLRSVLLVVDLALFSIFIYATLRALEFRPRFMSNPAKALRSPLMGDPAIRAQWISIMDSLAQKPPQSYALAVIEADKFTDSILVKLGRPGEHMADRLESLEASQLETIDEVWRAHRLRNELVHTPEFEISERDARSALQAYERFLTELGVLA